MQHSLMQDASFLVVLFLGVMVAVGFALGGTISLLIKGFKLLRARRRSACPPGCCATSEPVR